MSGYAASMLAESVSEALGLSDLGIDLREVYFSGGRIGFARHLTPHTRIGVSQELAGEQGQEVSIASARAPLEHRGFNSHRGLKCYRPFLALA